MERTGTDCSALLQGSRQLLRALPTVHHHQITCSAAVDCRSSAIVGGHGGGAGAAGASVVKVARGCSGGVSIAEQAMR